MDDTIRRDNGEPFTHQPTHRADVKTDDASLLPFRQREREAQALTKREREERWPIG